MDAPDVPVGDLDNWRQVFVENFDTDVALGDFPEQSEQWGAYPSPWKDTSNHGTYTPHKVVSITDGVLTKFIHTEGTTRMITALLPDVPGSSSRGQLFARYALRWRMDQMPGYKIAWMLWPDSDDRLDGEVDFPEMNTDADAVGGYVHQTARGPIAWVLKTTDATLWHTSIIEWSPGLVVFIHDGVEVQRFDQGIPDTPMHWVLQTETELGGAPTPAADVEGNVQIAWVAAWQWDPTAHAPPTPRTVTLTAPATAVGKIPVTVEASPDVSQVKVMIDETEVGWDSTRPFARTIDSTRHANGKHELWVKATDGHGWFNSPRRTITMRNTLQLVCPTTCVGTVVLSITPWPWIREVKWVVDGHEVGSRQQAPYSTRWNTTGFPNGAHTIYVKARSNEYGWADGPERTITVANG